MTQEKHCRKCSVPLKKNGACPLCGMDEVEQAIWGEEMILADFSFDLKRGFEDLMAKYVKCRRENEDLREEVRMLQEECRQLEEQSPRY